MTTARRIVLWTLTAACLALSARELVLRGGVSRPRTVISHSGMAPERAEASLLLLRRAARTIPPNARVALVKPNGRWDDAGMLAVAHGQLPRQHAVPASTLDPGGDPPDFVVAVDAPLDDPRYQRIYEGDGGGIWERVR